MSGKKSTRKRKVPAYIQKYVEEKMAIVQTANDFEIATLNRSINDLYDRLNSLIATLNYNQIFPEPKNRWIPSVQGDLWDWDEICKKKDTL